jgi:hypothetical protein
MSVGPHPSRQEPSHIWPPPALTPIESERSIKITRNSNRIRTFHGTPGVGGTPFYNPPISLTAMHSISYGNLPSNPHRIILIPAMYPPTPLESYSFAKAATPLPPAFCSTGFNLCAVATPPRSPTRIAQASLRHFLYRIASLLHPPIAISLPALCVTLDFHAA